MNKRARIGQNARNRAALADMAAADKQPNIASIIRNRKSDVICGQDVFVVRNGTGRRFDRPLHGDREQVKAIRSVGGEQSAIASGC